MLLQRYDEILSDSRDLAAKLSAQTDRKSPFPNLQSSHHEPFSRSHLTQSEFDTLILDMVNNNSITIENKIILIDWYISVSTSDPPTPHPPSPSKTN